MGSGEFGGAFGHLPRGGLGAKRGGIQLPKIFLPVLAEGEPDTAGVREGVEAHGGKLDDIAVAELGVGGEGVVDGLLESAAQH